MKTFLFTPRMSATDNTRLRMQVSAEDHAKFKRGQSWRATMTDQITGIAYRIRGASCGASHCLCDAVILDRATVRR